MNLGTAGVAEADEAWVSGRKLSMQEASFSIRIKTELDSF